METTAYIALGGNVGQRVRTLLRAAEMLDEVDGVRVRRISRFRETDPVGGPPDQPKYVNAAAELQTSLTPEELLAALHEIENALGRNRNAEQRCGPRTCDLDLLLMGELVADSEDLTVPHPRMHERRFVLQPLSDLAPDAIHPTLHKTVAQLLAEVAGDADR